jgi:hypothetical protein
VARRDLPETGIVGDPSVRHVVREGNIEIQNAFFAELHDRVGKHGLADRTGFEQRIRVHRGGRAGLLHAKAASPGDLPIADEGDRQARHVSGG